MKRDVKLVKEILAYVENSDTPASTISFENGSPFKGYSVIMVSHHIELLISAEYLNGEAFKPEASDELIMAWVELTWKGYEFLDVLKDHEILTKLLTVGKKGVTSLSFEAIKTLASKLVENKAKKYLGISD